MCPGRTRVPGGCPALEKALAGEDLDTLRSADRPTPYSSTSSFSVGISAPGLMRPRTMADPRS